MERKMSAVLVADMVAFSRLMELDELDTFERQKTYLAEVFDPEISGHNGRIVKTTGDGVKVAARPEHLAKTAGRVVLQSGRLS